MNRRRGRLEVINEILSIARKPTTKTRICKKANMSFEMGKKYLDLLLENDLIEFESSRNDDLKEGYYSTTDYGFEFLRNFNQIERLIVT